MFVPSWDGNPHGWRRYRDEVRIWLLSERTTGIDYSLAARLVQRLSGAARRAAMTLSDLELMPDAGADAKTDADGAVVVPAVPADPRAGVRRVLTRLEDSLTPEITVRRGASMMDFFGTRKIHRRAGERISEYSIRFDEGVNNLKDDGIDIDALMPILGWFFLQMATLTVERRERATAALPEGGFTLDAVRRVCIRLFQDIHVTDPRDPARRLGGPLPSARPQTGAGPGVQRRQVNVTEKPDDIEDDDDPEHDEENEEDAPFDVQAVMHEELDGLVQDLEQFGNDDLTEDDSARLDQAALTIAGVNEALATVREIRGKVNKGPPPRHSGSQGARAAVSQKGRGPKAKASPGANAAAVKARKANSTCRVCNRKGHWGGDPECPGAPDGGAREAHMIDGPSKDDTLDLCVINVNALTTTTTTGDLGRAVIDTAAAASVAGGEWTNHYLKQLRDLGLGDYVKEEDASEQFRFGDGATVLATRRITAPAVIACKPIKITWFVVENVALPLLLGRDFVINEAVIIDLKRNRLVLGSRFEVMQPSTRGHFSVGLAPERFRQLTASENAAPSLLPRRVSNRGRLGQTMTAVCYAIAMICARAPLDTAELPAVSRTARERVPLAALETARVVLACDCKSGMTPDSACRDCGDQLCADCAIGERCVGCYANVQYPHSRGPPDSDGALTLQKQSLAKIKSGTALQLEAGRRHVKTLCEHGMIAQGITDAVGTQVLKASQGHGVPAKSPLLLEWCCSTQSQLARRSADLGIEAIRFDASERRRTAGSREAHAWAVELARAARRANRKVCVWVALPCTAWSTWQRLAKDPASLARKRMASVALLRRTTCLIKDLMELNVDAYFEWPRFCDGWSAALCPPMAELLRLLPARAAVDGCALGVVSRDGLPLRKAWRLQTSRRDSAAALEKRCPGDHRHGKIEGSETTKTGFYTKEAADHFLTVIFNMAGQTITEALDAGRRARQALPADRIRRPLTVRRGGRGGDGGAAAAAEGAAAEADPARYSAALRAAIQKLHSQHGHPEPQALARAVRLAGGTDEAVSCALHFRCPVCARLHEPGPALPAALQDTAKQFGDLVALDTFTLADHSGHISLFLNMIDVATRFGIVSRLSSRHPLVVWLNFQRSWASWGGFPHRLLIDGGGEFEREFRQEAETVPMDVATTAAYTPTQNSVAERRGGAWKAIARSLIDEYSVSFQNESRTEWLVSAVNWAMNSQVSRSGYSPAQWVLGRSVRLPYDLLARPHQLSLHIRARDDPAFADRIALLGAAQRAATGLRYARGLSRAFLARSRVHDAAPAQHQFSLGDQVYYWRGRGRKRDWSACWHGPAVVIGYEANNLWLTHRNTTVKCSTRHVRLAEPEERLPWDQVFQQAFAEQPPNDPPRDAPAGDTDPYPPTFPGAGAPRARPDEFLDLTPDSRPGIGPGGKRRRLDPAAETAPQQPAAAAPQPHPTAAVPPPAGPAAEETVRPPPPAEPADPTANADTDDAMDDDTFDDYLRNTFSGNHHNYQNDARAQYRRAGFPDPDPPDPTASSSTTPPRTTSTTLPTSTPSTTSQPIIFGPHRDDNHPDHDYQADEEPDISGEEFDPPDTQPQPSADRRHLLDDVPLSVRLGLKRAPESAEEAPPAHRRRALLDDLPASVRAALRRPASAPPVPTAELPDQKRSRDVHLLHACGMKDCADLLLVGTSRAKEVDLKTLPEKEHGALLESMEKEWKVYNEFKAVAPLTQGQLDQIILRDPKTRIVDTRWVVTRKGGGFKSRLVVIGCQEAKGELRTDSPTGSHLMLMITLAYASQPGWKLTSLDARSAYLQSENIARMLLLRLPGKWAPPGCLPNQVMQALGAIYGTRDAGRSFYLHAKTVLEKYGLVELSLEKSCYALVFDKRIAAVVHTHVDDFLAATDGSDRARRVIEKIKTELHMIENASASFTYRGLNISHSDAGIFVNQETAALTLEPVDVRGDAARVLEPEEQSEYRAVVGRLLWLASQSRPDLAFGTSKASRGNQLATVAQARELNAVVRQAREHASFAVVLRRAEKPLREYGITCYADSAFANIEGVKSQCGHLGGLCLNLNAVSNSDFTSVIPLWWNSSTVKRVCRSTLACEGYAVSEGVEQSLYVREILSEIETSPGTQRVSHGHRMLDMNIDLFSDSNSLVTTVLRDTGLGADKRFAIVVAGLRETFAPKGPDRCRLSWTPTWRMVADPLTKIITSALLAAFFRGIKGVAQDPKSHAVAMLMMANRASAHEIDVVVVAIDRPSLLTIVVSVFVMVLSALWMWWGRSMLTYKTDVAVQTSLIFARDAQAVTAEAGRPRESLETVRSAAPPLTARNWASRKLYVTPFGECFHLDPACPGLSTRNKNFTLQCRRSCTACCPVRA